MEPVYRGMEVGSRAALRLLGSRLTVHGSLQLPESTGAVVAINHTSYLDFMPAALAVNSNKRRLRFMIKAEMKDVRVVNFLITRARTIPVDRTAGADAYAVAVEELRGGELVAVYPEATISRSFELKEFKSGATRMATEANVPIVPLIVWGVHRRWTKDHPKTLGRKKIPISVWIGEPIAPDADPQELDIVLRERMTELLHRAQQEYPHPAGEYWVPDRLGGSAPTPAEAEEMDAAELAARAYKRTQAG